MRLVVVVIVIPYIVSVRCDRKLSSITGSFVSS